MENTISINSNEMTIREYNGQRVVTFKDIDTVHGRTNGTAGRNFRDNKKRFIEGVDYFKVCADEIRRDNIMDISPKAHAQVVLITESGYLMLAKSFTDDLAWTVQRELVNNYFRKKETLPIGKDSEPNSVPLGWIAGRPKMVNVDDCIVALEVLRDIKHNYIVCKQEYEQKDPAIGMVAYYEKHISAMDCIIESVGSWLVVCSAKKRFI